MRMDRNICFYIMLLSIFCALLSGCERQEATAFEIAAQSYADGNYAAAEVYFVEALESEEASDVVRLGHGYNLAALGENTEAIDELLKVQDSFADSETGIAIRRLLLELYLEECNYAGAARVCSELGSMCESRTEREEYELQAAVICADMYRTEGLTGALEEELKNIINLKVYAGDEYLELYEMYIAADLRQQRLKLADEIAVYMTGHSAYIEDFTMVIGVMFDAAEVAGYTEWDYDTDHYFTQAEKFISLAEEAGLSSTDLIRYKIIIAERRGKLELAEELLGVYLNHYPEDEDARKEYLFLADRLR